MSVEKSWLPDLKEVLDELGISQLRAEKNAFDMINSSDISLNLVKDGMHHIQDASYKIELIDDIINEVVDKLNKVIDSIDQDMAETESLNQLFVKSFKEIHIELEKATQLTNRGEGLMNEVVTTYQKIMESEEKANDIARTLEEGVANQREIVECAENIVANLE